MDRRTVRVAAVAALSIIALSAAAATLDTATSSGGGLGPANADGGNIDDSPGDSPFGFDEEGGGNPFAGSLPLWGGCLHFLRSVEFILGVIAVVALIGYIISKRYDPVVAFAGIFAWGLPLFVVYLFLAACPTAPESSERTGLIPSDLLNASMPSGGGMLGQASGQSPAPPSLLMLALLGVVFLAAVVVIFKSTGDDEQELPEAPVEPETDDDRIQAIGRVAGAAADRIDAQGEVGNEVYRAWRQMVSLLEVTNPQATTPGEFADAATEAGMDRADVEVLTDLFESVRYGGFEATEAREAQAISALRNIESTYADEDAGWSSDRDRK